MVLNKQTRVFFDIVLYVLMFFVIQYVMLVGVSGANAWHNGISWAEFSSHVYHGAIGVGGKLLVAVSALSSIVTIIVFVYARWARLTRAWLSMRPWTVLVWVACLALGSILPSQWLQEQMNLTVPESAMRTFESIMSEPVGYMAIGVLAPLAEEVVFRGAILGNLLHVFTGRMHWIAIAISALIFGAVHGNEAQFAHAMIIGLLLGWMYYRTNSIIPGVVFHWINNTVAYLMFNLLPSSADGQLIDLFHGDSRTMWLGLLFSVCIIVPSLYQLALRLKRSQG